MSLFNQLKEEQSAAPPSSGGWDLRGLIGGVVFVGVGLYLGFSILTNPEELTSAGHGGSAKSRGLVSLLQGVNDVVGPTVTGVGVMAVLVGIGVISIRGSKR